MAIVRYKLDPKNPPKLSPGTRARIDAMTAEEIERNAEADPDNPPMTDDELARAVFARAARKARETSGLSQAKFAQCYKINLSRLRDLEQGRYRPDSALQAYLAVIEHNPKAVLKVLEKSRVKGTSVAPARKRA